MSVVIGQGQGKRSGGEFVCQAQSHSGCLILPELAIAVIQRGREVCRSWYSWNAVSLLNSFGSLFLHTMILKPAQNICCLSNQMTWAVCDFVGCTRNSNKYSIDLPELEGCIILFRFRDRCPVIFLTVEHHSRRLHIPDERQR
jgi:hypothetical protein